MGFPVFLNEEFFASATHPAALNQFDQGRLRIRHFHGDDLKPGDRVELPSTVLGVARAGQAVAEFRTGVQRLSRRVRRSHVRPYSLFIPVNNNDISRRTRPTKQAHWNISTGSSGVARSLSTGSSSVTS
ncbi:MAG: hypothetical protein HY360_10710 [Verrucomicrobia bacterium]|nr:hypothetical protein [Verrucomicrobiota bacterium]